MALATWIAFSSVGQNEFVNYDDGVYIYNNPRVQHGLSPSMLGWAFTTGYASNWHPLTWIGHTINWDLFGKNPSGHHAVNVFLHTISAIVTFLVLLRMTDGTGREQPRTGRGGKATDSQKQDRREKRTCRAGQGGAEYLWPSAFVAAMFAVHPLRVESVAWAAELKDVLCTLFWWLSMAAYVAYVRQPSLNRYLILTACFVLGLLSKPMIVTLPIVLLLLDYWPLRRFPDRRPSAPPLLTQCLRLVVEKLPLMALTVLSAVATYVAQSRGGTTTLLEHIPLPLRLGNAAMAAVAYLGQAAWPIDLACFYPYPRSLLKSGGILSVEVLSSFVLLAVITVAAIGCGSRWRFLLVGWLWYLVTLVPVIGIIQVGRQARADRYTYLPLVGVAIAIVWGMHELAARLPALRPWFRGAGAMVLFVWMGLTWRQVHVWRDDVTLFSHAALVIPGNETAEINLGNRLVQLGRFDEGLVHMRKAIDCRPDYAPAYRNLAVGLEMAGRPRDAEKYFQQALQIQPDWVLVMCNLAMLYATSQDPAMRKPAEALRYANEAVRFTKGRDALALEVLTSVYVTNDDLPRALEVAERGLAVATESQPNYVANFQRTVEKLRAHLRNRERTE